MNNSNSRNNNVSVIRQDFVQDTNGAASKCDLKPLNNGDNLITCYPKVVWRSYSGTFLLRKCLFSQEISLDKIISKTKSITTYRSNVI